VISYRAMTTAFVLSGGASLGAIQVGMLKALFEAGIRPTSVIGTSVGAINGAFLAGQPNEAGIERLESIWRKVSRSQIFPTRPLGGLMGFIGRRNHLVPPDGLRRLVRESIWYDRLEHAEIPVAVVVTEVRTGAEVVLDKGPVEDAIVASASIPGVFPPVTIDGRTYMDGGVADNTPLSHPVLAGAHTVYVLPCGTPCALADQPTSALGVVLQAIGVLVQQRLWHDVARYSGACALHVVPPLCPLAVAPLDFSQSAQLIDRAYESTRQWMAEGAPSIADRLRPHAH
jgi:NTE family protein